MPDRVSTGAGTSPLPSDAMGWIIVDMKKDWKTIFPAR